MPQKKKVEQKSSHRKPGWLKIQLPKGGNFTAVKEIVEKNHLHTICTSGKCPNMGECWSAGTATFMILGEICTRSCKFCATKTGKPLPVVSEEPFRVAESIQKMKLKHCVITSVDRDDLPDGGASHWTETILKIKELNPNTTIEVLIPDFGGNLNHVQTVCDAHPDIISHNLETVERLTPQVRSAAQYRRSLEVLKHIATSGVPAKSGLMLGLGETEAEILQTMDDLCSAGVRILTLGQYLQPSKTHLPVVEYVHPDTFAHYKTIGLEKKFQFVESAPLVRSSYHAEKHIG